MRYRTLEKNLLSFKGSHKDFPFGADVAVFKVASKMFALVPLDSKPLQMNLKCDPMEAATLRSMFESIKPGYHMNKDHWNTIILDGGVPKELVLKMIEDSYLLVKKRLKKSEQEQL